MVSLANKQRLDTQSTPFVCRLRIHTIRCSSYRDMIGFLMVIWLCLLFMARFGSRKMSMTICNPSLGNDLRRDCISRLGSKLLITKHSYCAAIKLFDCMIVTKTGKPTFMSAFTPMSRLRLACTITFAVWKRIPQEIFTTFMQMMESFAFHPMAKIAKSWPPDFEIPMEWASGPTDWSQPLRKRANGRQRRWCARL